MNIRFLISLVLLLCVSGCASAGSSASGSGGMEVSNATVFLPGGNSMDGMDMDTSLAGYMQIKNASGTDDRLMGVTSDFADAMLHETRMNGDVASMQEVAAIDIPAGSTVDFKGGGLHVMFTNLKQDLKEGDTVNWTLQFEKAGNITVPATVTAR
jgi:periplasmic copper chaperone A